LTLCKEKKTIPTVVIVYTVLICLSMRAQKNLPDQLKLSDFEDKSLLILDDDDPLRGRLARAMEKKGFQVKEAKTVAEGLNIVKVSPPSFACVDLRLEDGNGLDVIKELTRNKKDSRIVMLTGYGNLPTAVAAVKAGAIDYIAKPVDADDVESALLASPESNAKPPENPMSADRVKWEHIHRVFELCNRNVSETARRLKMHRRTLQRILSKRSPK
jgi:two-component system, response regulator RegA